MPTASHGQELDAPLDFAIEGPLAILTLNRPAQGNALDTALLDALEQAWQRVEAEPAIRVAIITGAGQRHFCTGADVSELKVGKGKLNNLPYEEANRFSPRMAKVSKPVICVVNGLANGGGLHFVADSDIVVACRDATFMDSHTTVGQVSALETQGVARRAGLGAALLMALAGRSYRMSCDRAHTLGLVDLIEENAETALATAKRLGREIAQNSPQALVLTKRAIWAATEMPDPQAAQYGWELLKSHWAHSDFSEGPAAFAEKRSPSWNPDPNAR